jgi:signal transduction histidine kinase
VTAPPAEKPDILTSIRTSDVPVSWIKKTEGTTFFCMGSYISDLDWVIILQQPLPEIYTYLYRNLYWAIGLTVFICITALVLGWSRVRRFLTPIQTLHQQVLNIGRGNLEQKVSVDSHDEIGELGLAFNEMTDSLKEYIRREVESAKELAHAKNLAILGTTSSKVTHEVGNLLNNIGMILSVLKTEALTSRAEKALGMLEHESDRVRAFIQNFLQFAKKPELNLQKTPLDRLIKETLIIFQPDAEKRGIRLEFDWPPDVPPATIDPGLMYQVVNNLVKNSMEAIADSGSICVQGEIEAEHLRLTVQDTGAGMAPEILEQIFDPFFSTKGQKGTGLGLAVVKTIVEAHRGTIECRSELNQGTAVIVRLPWR